jgi:amino acid transporter
MAQYEKNSLSLAGAVALGTGVMVGAGIFALTGQVAQLAGAWFPLAFLLAAVVSGLSAHSYITVSRKYPSAGGIAMILSKAYGQTAVAAGAAMLMAFSMVINESLVARTFGTYTLQLFGVPPTSVWVPVLAVGVILVGFGITWPATRPSGPCRRSAPW